jgi:signal transduction histidine kinase
MLRALDTQRPSSSPPAASAIQPIIDVVNGVIRSVRSMTGGLFARAVAEGGLPSALLRLAQSSTERSNVAVECRVHLPPDYLLEPSRADHLYHIAQEATTNALRHGGAAHILIELALDAAGLRLTIADDGCGITAEREAAGNGLRIMRYRAAAAGGELRIERGIPRGTRVEYRAMPPRAANSH